MGCYYTKVAHAAFSLTLDYLPPGKASNLVILDRFYICNI